VLLKVRKIGDPPDVISAAILVHIFVLERLARNLFASRYGLEHRAIAEATSTHVIDLTATGLLQELVEGANKVSAVDIVPYLLLLVAEDGVGGPCNGALHQVGKKSMELRP
jgi:hypothetical protein